MEVSRNITDILLLYELSMAIGKTLDFRENCATFLKLFLARKGLTAAWILQQEEGRMQCTYSLPDMPCEVPPPTDFFEGLGAEFDSRIFPAADDSPFSSAPAPYRHGTFTVFNLRSQGFLVVHSNRNDPFTEREMNQLRPIMRKLSHTLEGAATLARQQEIRLRLEEQNRRLNDYAHVVSHDLKSPLHNINTLAGWVMDDHEKCLPADALEKLRLIRTNTERMEQLISGLLSYSSVSDAQHNFRKVNLNRVVTEVLGLVSIPENVEMEIADLPEVYGDPLHFTQLFQNLLDNAIKSLDKPVGRINVGYREDQGTPEFFVADNGKGIDRKYHERIFKIFQKLDTDGTRSGIGLSIVQKIIEHYKGRIWLESQPGTGSTFYFTFGASACAD